MVRVMIAAAALLCVGAAQESQLGWMSGGWCTEAKGGRQTCEAWSDGAAGAMDGLSRTVKDGKTVSEERMSISTIEGHLTFTALPSDAAEPTRFTLISRDATELVFENRAHDYPQRIKYWRDGEVLMAEISLADGTKPMRWRYQRQD